MLQCPQSDQATWLAKLVFVVEAMAHGKIETDYIEDMIVVSKCSMLHWLYLQCHWVTIQYFVNCYSLALFPADNEGMAIDWKKLHGGRERERQREREPWWPPQTSPSILGLMPMSVSRLARGLIVTLSSGAPPCLPRLSPSSWNRAPSNSRALSSSSP